MIHIRSWLRHLTKAALGQSVIELALTLPLLSWVMLGTIDFARVYYLQSAVTNAANAGAQFALESRHTMDEVRQIVVQEAAPLININPISSISLTANPSWAPGNSLRVDVVQSFTAITPFISAIWGGGPLTVRGTAVVRFNP